MRLADHAFTATLLAATATLNTAALQAQRLPLDRHASPLALPRIFSDGMVLQRDRPISIWGWGQPGQRVVIGLEKTTAAATVDRKGRWTARLPKRGAGGPFQLVVREGSDSVAVSNVLIGDVWVASGQSNMEMRVAQSAPPSQYAEDTLVREFKIPNSWSLTPDSDVAGGQWLPGDTQHVGSFSAVAFYFAAVLRARIGVPIGIVNATWSGSNIETWISRGAQKITDSAWSAIERSERTHDDAVRDSLRAILGPLPASDAGLIDSKAVWADPSFDDTSWRRITVPAYWESQGYPGLDGIGWYRTTFDLAPDDIPQGIMLTLAGVDDDDIAWVNGVEIGRTNGYDARRRYFIPDSILHAGHNVLAIRVADGGGGGGINGDVTLVLFNGTRRSLNGQWRFKVGLVEIHEDGQRINKVPAILYNKMIHPILPYSIKGAIWYQGESNSNNDAQAIAYRDQFRTLITSWRKDWTGADPAFPFLWVQLPSYGKADDTPPLHAAWALQRESMDGALSLVKTGRAITYDLGEADNLHPRNKEEVASRLAAVAMRVAYNSTMQISGPKYAGFSRYADTLVVSFTHLGGGFVVREDSVGGFAIAGADKRFVWANAKIVGNKVYVWSSRVPKPVAVRFAFDNNPDRARLVTLGDFPTEPFRSDRW